MIVGLAGAPLNGQTTSTVAFTASENGSPRRSTLMTRPLNDTGNLLRRSCRDISLHEQAIAEFGKSDVRRARPDSSAILGVGFDKLGRSISAVILSIAASAIDPLPTSNRRG